MKSKTEKIFSCEEVRALDRRAIQDFGVPSIILMENAGRGVVEYLISTCHAQGKIVICCGKGNNAGDGFVVARHLDNMGLSVHILLFADQNDLIGDAKINYELALKSLLSITVVKQDNFNTVKQDILAKADWIIDALFGTGLRGKVEPPYDNIIQAMNETNIPVLSIDIPSGMDCDSGEPLGIAVKATHTVTFVGIKKGFVNPAAKQFLGHVHVVDIGIPKILMKSGV